MTGSADVIVMAPSLDAVPKLFKIATMTMRQAQWNAGWAIAYNLASVGLASGVLSRWNLVVDA
jgi:cation transport ATPase